MTISGSAVKQLSAEALDVLGSGLEIMGKQVFIIRQLDRKLYVEVNEALEALGGEWTRKVKAHVFDESPEDALDQVLSDGVFHDKKRDLDQFFTPANLAKDIVERADVRGHDVLEPSAGHGALVAECLRQGARRVVSIEVDPKAHEVLRRMPYESGSHCPYDPCDFLTFSEKERFTRIVMNPPFGRQKDLLHVTHAFGFLKPGGRLVSVMSAGVEFRTDKKTKAFSRLVSDYGSIRKLPPQSFRESGTDVNTVLVTLERPV
jgi:predicted RNA methylase